MSCGLVSELVLALLGIEDDSHVKMVPSGCLKPPKAFKPEATAHSLLQIAMSAVHAYTARPKAFPDD